MFEQDLLALLAVSMSARNEKPLMTVDLAHIRNNLGNEIQRQEQATPSLTDIAPKRNNGSSSIDARSLHW